jgi:6-pyruvoyltetrahydropterin/6-carboxytetrahydropterin synthase
MRYAITTTLTFLAAHQLRLYDGSMEPLHEHLWRVKVTAASDGLDSIGVVMDFHELTRRVQSILSALRGRLNDLPDFTDANPSAENVAVFIARRLTLPDGVKLASVEVWETEENSAVFSP